MKDLDVAFKATKTEELRQGTYDISNGSKHTTVVHVDEKKGKTTARIRTIPASSFHATGVTYYFYTHGISTQTRLDKPVDITLSRRNAHVVAEPVDNPIPGIMEAKVFSMIWHKNEGEPPEG